MRSDGDRGEILGERELVKNRDIDFDARYTRSKELGHARYVPQPYEPASRSIARASEPEHCGTIAFFSLSIFWLLILDRTPTGYRPDPRF